MTVKTMPLPDELEKLRSAWSALSEEERIEKFMQLSRADAVRFFEVMTPRSRAQIIQACPKAEQRLWIRMLAPDDAADVLQEVAPEDRGPLLELLDAPTRREVRALLAYAQDEAGGLMSPRFARVRPEMSIDEAITYLRRQARDRLETIYYVYVLDEDQRPQGVISLRELFTAPQGRKVSEVMNTEVLTVPEDMDQEAVVSLISEYNLLAVPVVDEKGRMKGIITVDDVMDVLQSEATEDMQKLGGLEALDTPYLQTSFPEMIKKRAGWLVVLFMGQTLTASAMSRYEAEISQAMVLAIFVPLIISSGGNSGSQAATLVIRAMALGQVRLKDWWRIVRRELGAGFVLGCIVALLGVARIAIWQTFFNAYGDQALLVGITVSLSLIGVVTWGTLAGSMLPFVLRTFRFDPASASAPFVATLVDVSGILIYFNIARAFLLGTMS